MSCRMDASGRTALLDAVRHWDDILSRLLDNRQTLLDHLTRMLQGQEDETLRHLMRVLGIHMGSGYCPLCQLYWTRHGSCNGCPVQRATGCPSCHHTPYWAIDVCVDMDDTPEANYFALTEAVRCELGFLARLYNNQ